MTRNGTGVDWRRPRGKARLTALATAMCLWCVGALPAAAVGSPGRSSTVVPATPTVTVTLKVGINTDPNLSPSQKAQVASDVAWLQGRLNVMLPQIRSPHTVAKPSGQWTGGVLPTNGVFDARTASAVQFFQTWANYSRSLLHESPLFGSINGAVGPTTADIVAFVAGYFQNHPAPGNPDQVDALTLLNQDRFAHGLPLLGSNPQLMQVAQAWADHLAATSTEAHDLTLKSKLTVCWKILSENVGFGPSVAWIENAFILDTNIVPPVHRINIENGALDEVGVGVGVNHGVYFLVQDFIKSC